MVAATVDGMAWYDVRCKDEGTRCRICSWPYADPLSVMVIGWHLRRVARRMPDAYELADLPCGCQDVHYADGSIDHEHDHVACDG